MKLIINISNDVYARLFDSGIRDNEIAVGDVCEIARALRLGTPLDNNSKQAEILQAYFDGEVHGWERGRKALLDDVKAEIEQGICTANNDYDKGRNYGLYMATQILDNIGKESEVQK